MIGLCGVAAVDAELVQLADQAVKTGQSVQIAGRTAHQCADFLPPGPELEHGDGVAEAFGQHGCRDLGDRRAWPEAAPHPGIASRRIQP